MTAGSSKTGLIHVLNSAASARMTTVIMEDTDTATQEIASPLGVIYLKKFVHKMEEIIPPIMENAIINSLTHFILGLDEIMPRSLHEQKESLAETVLRMGI